MIREDRIRSFLESLETDNADFLEKIEKNARERFIPVIRREEQGFLKFMLSLLQPEKILEIGTAVGFSSLFMAEYGKPGCRITTVEIDPGMACEAKRNAEENGYAEQIRVLEGDAAEVLKTLDGTFDLVFMDAAKGQYPALLPSVLALMHPGSVMITDNILQEGDILESRFAVERRDRTIHSRMRQYLYDIKHHPDMTTALIPLGDGLAVSVMR